MQGGPSAFTNTSTGVIYGDYNGVYASSTTNFTSFANAGSITSARGPAVEATAGGTFTNTGTIRSTGTTANSIGILIRNNVNAEIVNSGTIGGGSTAISFALAGGTAFAATYTLRLQTGSVLNGNVLGGANTDRLILEGTGTESIAKFSAFETLTMNGTDWTLNGNGTFSTSATVQGGIMRVAGQLTSPIVSVLSGGTLTGTGTVAGNVSTSSGGTVQVNAATTLVFNGNYIHQSGGFFTVGVTTTTTGLLTITGIGHTATLNGGTVRVEAGMGNYTPNTQYTILTATGGVNGTFGGVTTNFAFLTPTLSYDANNVYLNLALNNLNFAAVGNTPNQRSSGTGVEALGLSNSLVSKILTLSPEQARAAFDSLSGEIHPSIQTLLLNDNALLRDAILGRQRQDAGSSGPSAGAISFADDGTGTSSLMSYTKPGTSRLPAKARPWPVKAAPINALVHTVWAQGYGNFARIDGDGNAASLRYNTGGGVAGYDVTINGNARIGFALGGAHSDARVDARLSTATIDTFNAAIYAGGYVGNLALRGAGSYSRHEVSTNRTIMFPGFSDQATARYNAGTAQLFGETAYGLTQGPLRSEAFGNLAYVRVDTDAFGELSNGGAALSVASAQTNSTFSTLGLRAQTPVPFAAMPIIARASLGWQHAFDAGAPISLMAFSTSPAPFVIAGVPLARDMLATEAGLEAAIRYNVAATLAYSSRINAETSAHAVTGKLAVNF